MSKNYELELYKLIMNPDEDDHDISYVDEFVKRLKDIFGYSLFDEGGIEARIGCDYVCIDLQYFVGEYGVDLEEVFPKSKYRH